MPNFLANAGEIGSLIAACDWRATPLGPIEGWQEPLTTLVSTILAASPPMALLWGAEGILLYNAGYAEIAGDRHPDLLGRGVLEGWPEAADFNRHVLEVCRGGGRLTYRDRHLVLERNGVAEDTWFDLDYSAVRDGAGTIVGVFALVFETTARHRAEAELASKQQRFGHALAASGVIGIWDWHVPSDQLFADARFAEFFQIDAGRAALGVPRADVEARVHPDDRAYVSREVLRALAAGTDLSVEHRLIDAAGEVRWVMIRGTCFRDAAGTVVRISGAGVEITHLKTIEESRRLLVRELHHRIKNTFAVIAGMVTMTARTASSVAEMAEVLRGRLVALAAAHELIRPAVTAEVGHTEKTTLADLLAAILTPHLFHAEQLTLVSKPVEIGVMAATSLALVLHELATNAAKYGALSTPKGELLIIGEMQERYLELEWRESEGPVVEGVPAHQGFGSRLAQMSIVGQLAGSIAFDWRPQGLVVRMTIARDRLAR